MLVTCLLVSAAFAQSSSQSSAVYGRDINGNPMLLDSYSSTRSNGNSVTTEYTTSVNGRKVPLESTEEKVVSEDAGGRVVERVIRRYDPNGNPGPVERQRIEVRNNPDGSTSSVTNVFRSDMNGRSALTERVVADGAKSGNTVTVNTRVERTSLNGGLELAEKQVRTETTDDKNVRSDTTTYRKDPTGRFVESLRLVTDRQEQNGQTVQNVAQYERVEGALQLHQQTVTRTRKNDDGTEAREVDIYRNVPGRADTSATPKLTERQVTEQRKEGDRLVERTTAQRPTISDPNRLGTSEVIAERVCTGKCN